MIIGFIGLGNLGSKLAGTPLRTDRARSQPRGCGAAPGPGRRVGRDTSRPGVALGPHHHRPAIARHQRADPRAGRRRAAASKSQVTLNRSYDSNFTVDLVLEDIGLFLTLARQNDKPTKVADTVTAMFRDTQSRHGGRAPSARIMQRLEDDCGFELRAAGFPAKLTDPEPEAPGEKIVPSQTCYVTEGARTAQMT